MSDPVPSEPPMSGGAPSNGANDELNTESTAAVSPPLDPSSEPPYTHTRASAFWAAVVVGLLILLILIVFILENGQRASVSFMGAHGHLPEGVALLLAAVVGGLFVVLAAVARILQLRNRARKQNVGRTGRGHHRTSRTHVTR